MFNLILFLICFVMVLFSTFIVVNLPFISLFGLYNSAYLPGTELIFENFLITVGYYTGNLQVPAVLLSSVILNPRLSFFFITSYLLLGFSGFPVFYFGGGTDYLQQPSAGYVLAFLPMVIFISKLSWRKEYERYLFNSRYVFLICFLGLILMHLIGIIYAFIVSFNYNVSFLDLLEVYFFMPFTSQVLVLILAVIAGTNFNRLKLSIFTRYHRFITNLYNSSIKIKKAQKSASVE